MWKTNQINRSNTDLQLVSRRISSSSGFTTDTIGASQCCEDEAMYNWESQSTLNQYHVFLVSTILNMLCIYLYIHNIDMTAIIIIIISITKLSLLSYSYMISCVYIYIYTCLLSSKQLNMDIPLRSTKYPQIHGARRRRHRRWGDRCLCAVSA